MEKPPEPQPETLDADEIIAGHTSGQHGLPPGAIKLLLILQEISKD